LYAGVVAVLGGAGYYFYNQGDNAAKVKAAAKDAENKAKGAVGDVAVKKALTGGDQGFINVVLEQSEIINHNTKKLRFKLPEEDQVSGLKVASALLTKYKGPQDEKATLRPYTPVSDESELLWPHLAL
jgi:cytochrome-b5 reductase